MAQPWCPWLASGSTPSTHHSLQVTRKLLQLLFLAGREAGGAQKASPRHLCLWQQQQQHKGEWLAALGCFAAGCRGTRGGGPLRERRLLPSPREFQPGYLLQSSS